MRIVSTWVVPFVVVAAVVIGVSYFQGGMFHHTPQNAPAQGENDVWVPVPHPPGDRVQPQLPVVKEFGAWHYACAKSAEQSQAPKVGYIQNFGIVSSEGQYGKPEPCHVFIMMRDSAAAGQTMVMAFRYRKGIDQPQLAVIYTTSGGAHVIYDRTGQMHDLTKKEKMRGGFFRDPNRAPDEKLRVEAKQIPIVGIQLGRESVSALTTACMKGHCFARFTAIRTADFGSQSQIVVRLPALPRGKPRQIDVPAEGLATALAELARTRAS